MIHEEICTYEVCKLAKEKGFPQQIDFGGYWYATKYYKNSCLGEYFEEERTQVEDYHDKSTTHYFIDEGIAISAPTQSLLQRWLRKERGIIVEVFMDDDSNMPLTYNIHQYKDWNWECVCHHHGNYYAVNDWELCLEDALKYALENLVI